MREFYAWLMRCGDVLSCGVSSVDCRVDCRVASTMRAIGARVVPAVVVSARVLLAVLGMTSIVGRCQACIGRRSTLIGI